MLQVPISVNALHLFGIIHEEPYGNETDFDNDKREPDVFDGELITKIT